MNHLQIVMLFLTTNTTTILSSLFGIRTFTNISTTISSTTNGGTNVSIVTNINIVTNISIVSIRLSMIF